MIFSRLSLSCHDSSAPPGPALTACLSNANSIGQWPAMLKHLSRAARSPGSALTLCTCHCLRRQPATCSNTATAIARQFWHETPQWLYGSTAAHSRRFQPADSCTACLCRWHQCSTGAPRSSYSPSFAVTGVAKHLL